MRSVNGSPPPTPPQTPPDEQTAREEMEEHLAAATPLMVAPRMVAIEDYRASAAGYRNRVYDAHRFGLKLMGAPDEYITPSVEDKMGDLILQRDTIQNFPQAPAPKTEEKPDPAPAPNPAPAPAPAPQKQSWLLPALVGAGIGLGTLGAGLGAVSLLTDDDKPVVVQPGDGDITITNPNQPPVQNPPTSDRDWKASVYVTQPESQPTRPR